MHTPERHEVDFLARFDDGRTELIQVCADASGANTARRDLRALEEAGAALPRVARRLLTQTRAGLPVTVPSTVTAQPAYEWILAPAV